MSGVESILSHTHAAFFFFFGKIYKVRPFVHLLVATLALEPGAHHFNIQEALIYDGLC